MKFLILYCQIGAFLFALLNCVGASPVNNNEKPQVLSVCVIGAGTSGLAAAKYSLAEGYNVTVYEQTGELGGIWWYTDKTGKDEYGVNTHTSMYQGLRTNLPHQVMEYADHPYPEGTLPYPPQADVLAYIHSYADRFDLKQHIKFRHIVVRVLPIENGKWEIIVKNVVNNTFETNIYDAVFVCNGHFSSPRFPDIENIKEFKGEIIHSHDYRKAEHYRGESVLIIGAGPSGMDLAAQISRTASKVTFSQHKRPNETKDAREKRQNLLPPGCQLQDNVIRFTPDGADFIDGTHENFTSVIFATGYNFTYPFMSVETGIHVDNSHVQSLYKQIINIRHPTMALIGVPFTTSTTRMFDLQARFAIKFISGAKKLPSKFDMLEDEHIQTERHWAKGYRKHYTHYLGPEQKEYYQQLAETAEIENVPDVFTFMHTDSRATMARSPSLFRKYKYIVIDNKTFRKEKYED